MPSESVNRTSPPTHGSDNSNNTDFDILPEYLQDWFNPALAGDYVCSLPPTPEHPVSPCPILETDCLVQCDTNVQGVGDIWMISDTTDLCHIQPRARFLWDLVGDPIFVRSTMMINMDQCCNGSLIIFHTKKSSLGRLG